MRADYERVLKQRAALLKSAGCRRAAAGDLSVLDVWDGHLAEHGAQLLRARLAAVEALRPHAAGAYAQVAPDGAALTLRYTTAVPLPADDPVPRGRRAAATRCSPSSPAPRRAELDRGVNLVGPHRDDLDLGIGTLPVRGYASHGEGWSAALALRLGTFELLRADHPSGGDPVLVLDDVFAELDTERREQLALVAAKAEQAIVTAAVPTDVPDRTRRRALRGAGRDGHPWLTDPRRRGRDDRTSRTRPRTHPCPQRPVDNPRILWTTRSIL